MPKVTHPPNVEPTRAPDPGPTELLEEVADLSAGIGLGFMSFLGAIPGLLPCVALIVAALVVLAIPMVVVGLVGGVVYLLVRAIARIAARAATVIRPSAPEPKRPDPSDAAPAVVHRLPLEGPHAMV